MKRINGMQAFEAMTDIDPQYILKCAPDAPVIVNRKGRYLRVAAVAAALALLAVAAVIGLGSMNRGKNPSPVLPSEQETQNGAESADSQGDGTTAQTPTESEPSITESQPPEEESKPNAPISGSYATDKYTVEEIEGKYYLNFTDGNDVPDHDGSGNNLAVVDRISFSSLQEMRDKFLKGNFSEKEILQLKKQLPLTERGFEIFDMSNLHDVVLPERWSVSNVALQEDGSLNFTIQNPSTYNIDAGDAEGEHGTVSFFQEKQYNAYYEFYFASHIERIKDCLIEDETTFYGVPCQVYEHTPSTSRVRVVVFEIEEDGKKVEFMLTYYLKGEETPNISSAIPNTVRIFAEINGVKVFTFLTGLENTLNMDFLNSFDIKPIKFIE